MTNHLKLMLISFLATCCLNATANSSDRDEDTSGTLVLSQVISVPLSRGELLIEFVAVPQGEFARGGVGGDPDELPERRIHLDAFWIGRYEVTANQYALFLSDVGRDRNGDAVFVDTTDPGSLFRAHGDGSFGVMEGFEEFPAVGITWHGAKAFADWLAEQSSLPIDLPSEAQWEKAARGRDDRKRIFPWGVRLNTGLARYRSDQPTKVGSYPTGKSPFGAMDMAGNAAEWVLDWYDAEYYAVAPESNPPGPVNGNYRILRGGSWDSRLVTIPQLRSADRRPMVPGFADLTIGFRVALNAPTP